MPIEDLASKADLAAFIDERAGTVPQQIAQLRARLRYGTGSPEGVLAAPVGTLYVDLAGGASTVLYVKESGSSDSGWIAK